MLMLLIVTIDFVIVPFRSSPTLQPQRNILFGNLAWFILVHVSPISCQHKKKRDTFASAYRGVWHTLSTEWKKHTLNA